VPAQKKKVSNARGRKPEDRGRAGIRDTIPEKRPDDQEMGGHFLINISEAKAEGRVQGERKDAKQLSGSRPWSRKVQMKGGGEGRTFAAMRREEKSRNRQGQIALGGIRIKGEVTGVGRLRATLEGGSSAANDWVEGRGVKGSREKKPVSWNRVNFRKVSKSRGGESTEFSMPRKTRTKFTWDSKKGLMPSLGGVPSTRVKKLMRRDSRRSNGQINGLQMGSLIRIITKKGQLHWKAARLHWGKKSVWTKWDPGGTNPFARASRGNTFLQLI